MKPSDHVKIGECPFCQAKGTVINAITEETEPCPLCHGTKRWPPPEEDWEAQFTES
jgi:hypothetical protein